MELLKKLSIIADIGSDESDPFDRLRIDLLLLFGRIRTPALS